ncbi:MAG: aminopeptidase P family protein [Bacteroidales bacterium]|nr:aminopeptidase P family protein [Candidatus Hennigimonas equi]
MTDQHYVRVSALRTLMAAKGWDAVVLRGCDPHGSEYLSPRYQAVTWLSGFTGEAGDVVVTMDHAGLWTDSRYFIQAEAQLKNTGFELHKTRLPESVDIPHWLASTGCGTVVCDSLCESASSMEEIRRACTRSVPEFRLIGIPDFLDAIWQDRPGMPSAPVITLDETTVGMTRQEKIFWLRGWISSTGADFILLSTLDEIAWMLNVRGGDIDYNPLVYSYLLVGQDSAQWFVRKDGPEPDEDTLDSYAAVEADGISVEPYDLICDELSRLSADNVICYDPTTLNGCLSGILSDGMAVTSPVPLKKSVKTDVEIDGMREAYLEDGLAMEKFLYWLECTLKERPVSEWEASQKLGSLRAEIPGYRGDSFETISAWGPGAALPHYHTPHDGSSLIEPRGLYLCDSGGQYLFGTTDITRTVPAGETTYREKEDYTIVLKGMIDLSMAVFPYGTAGCQIDAIARAPLWKAGRNFGHGTGHGIGFYLCVHEGPQSIRQNFLQQPLLPGMVTSNEPGLYIEGSHGIRHENVILCKDAYTNEFGRWLCFETLTCCHFDTTALLPELLTKEELNWLNSYNEHVYKNFASAIEDEAMLRWLREKTLPAA